MLPIAKISHQTPERLRLKIPSRKGDSEYFLALKDQFTKANGVERLETNPATSSILIIHRGNSHDLVSFGETQNLFTMEKPSAQPVVSKGVVGGFNFCNDIIRKITHRELDIPVIAFIALVGVAIYQIARGNFSAPAWYTALWYGLNIFLKSLAHK